MFVSMKQKCCSDKKMLADCCEVASFLRIIGEINRLKILCILRDKECCVCEIWRSLDLPQNLASSHLKILREFGLINSRQEGKNNYYSINPVQFRKFNRLLNNFLKNYEQ